MKDFLFNTFLIKHENIDKYARVADNLYNKINVNTIDIKNNNKNGLLIIANHANNVSTIEDLLSNSLQETWEELITDLIIIAKSVEKSLSYKRNIYIVYFPSYNKSLYGNNLLEGIYKKTSDIINNICNVANILCDFIGKINIIYSHKSTDIILKLLKKNEIVIILYVSPNLLRLNKLNLFLNNTNNTILPLNIKEIKEDTYKLSKYDTFHDYVTEDDLLDIKSFLFKD